MQLAPICLFTYNRLSETKQTVEALQNNFLAKESDLFIFSDGGKNEVSKVKVQEIRAYIKTIVGFNSINIVESIENKGLANSIISGVTQVVNKYEKVIILEDDLITSPNFLNFMNQALDFYKNDAQVQSINGFSLLINSNINDVYFQTRPFPWGWATWQDRWREELFNKSEIKKEIDLNKELLKNFKNKCGRDISKMLVDSVNGVNDSWYVRWTYNHFINKTISVYPRESLVANIGFGADGTHCKGINTYRYKLLEKTKINFKFLKYKDLDKKTENDFLKYFTYAYKLKVRLKYLTTKSGRKTLKEDIKEKLK